jgi:ribosomal protein S18 acetylase RimI-like enzyme
MTIEVSEEAANLEDYARIRMSFEVLRVLDVTALDNGFGGFVMSERKLDVPYLKDYDAIESPLKWPRSFDISHWGFFAARSDGLRVGCAAVAFNTPGLTMLEGRGDIAVLWDIRVATEARRQGVGTALLRAVEKWALAKQCHWLKVETQNINVAACRFYAKQGFTVGAIHRFAYPDLPNETQLLWYKDLGSRMKEEV